jgi:hypothetical protein
MVGHTLVAGAMILDEDKLIAADLPCASDTKLATKVSDTIGQ